MINSLISQMANAQKMSIAQIQAGIQNGTIDAYVGIPLLEQKTKEAQKLQMAQALFKEQGAPDVSVKDQVMQAADQVTRPGVPPAPTLPATDRQRPAPSLGLEAARSNMPEEYAGGGIVAFANTGLVTNPDDVTPGRRDSAPTRAAGATDDQYVNDPYFGLTTPIWDADVLRRRRFFKSLGQDEPTARMQGPAPLENAPFRFSDAEPLPNARLKTSEMSPLPNARLDDGFKAFLDAGAKQPPAEQPAAPAPSGVDGLKIQRGVNPPPAAPLAAEAPSAFSGIEDLYKRYMDRSRTDRDELRNLILGQREDRAAQEQENRSTALMKAGFGMMAGRSPFAGVNIGEGAMAGVESYGKGLEQLRAGDRQIIQQLAALGLKGQELEQAAMKMGIDMSHYKMLEPYYASAAEENRAKSGLYPTQGRLYEAQVGETEAQTLERLTHANLMPEEVRQKGIRAAGAGRADMAGSVPAAAIDKLDTKVEGWIAEPLAPTTPFSSELRRNPQIVKALQLNDPENPEYLRAMEEVNRLAERERLKKMAEYRRESEKRRLPTYNPYAED